jgi:hypothetical protein
MLDCSQERLSTWRMPMENAGARRAIEGLRSRGPLMSDSLLDPRVASLVC